MSIKISSKPSLVDLFVKDLCLLLLLLSLLLEQLDQPGHLPLVVLDLGLRVGKCDLSTSSLDGQCDPYVSFFQTKNEEKIFVGNDNFYSSLLRGQRVFVTLGQNRPTAGKA